MELWTWIQRFLKALQSYEQKNDMGRLNIGSLCPDGKELMSLWMQYINDITKVNLLEVIIKNEIVRIARIIA